MAEQDFVVSAGYLADNLRPLVLASCDEGDSGTSCLKGTPMIPLHRATVSAIYQHLERLAKLDGEVTAGQRAAAHYALGGSAETLAAIEAAEAASK